MGRFAALALVYYYVFSSLKTGAAVFSTLLGAAFATFLLNAFTMKFLGSRAQRVLRRAMKAGRPKDGRLVAISGPLEALDQTLESPFGQRPCVAYSYWVGRYERVEDGGRILAKDFRGFAFAPCAVRTTLGAVGIRGISFDTLESFEEDVMSIEEAHGDVRRYLEEAHFEADPGHDPAALGRGLRDLRAEWTDPPAELRCDWGDNETILGQGHLAAERVVTNGQPVTAIGVYTCTPPELRSRGVDVLRLLPGDFEQARARLRTDATSTLFMAVLLFLVSHAFLVFIYQAAPRG